MLERPSMLVLASSHLFLGVFTLQHPSFLLPPPQSTLRQRSFRQHLPISQHPLMHFQQHLSPPQSIPQHLSPQSIPQHLSPPQSIPQHLSPQFIPQPLLTLHRPTVVLSVDPSTDPAHTLAAVSVVASDMAVVGEATTTMGSLI